MKNLLTASTEINVVVNGNETFTIKNSLDTGLLYITRSDMNKTDYHQGLLALAEACHNLLTHKINMDAERINNSNKTITLL